VKAEWSPLRFAAPSTAIQTKSTKGPKTRNCHLKPSYRMDQLPFCNDPKKTPENVKNRKT
jgi:hypothetical protein